MSIQPKKIIQAPWTDLTYKIIGLAMRKSTTSWGQDTAKRFTTMRWRSSSSRPG